MYIDDWLSEERYLRKLDFLLYSLFLYCVLLIVFYTVHCIVSFLAFRLQLLNKLELRWVEVTFLWQWDNDAIFLPSSTDLPFFRWCMATRTFFSVICSILKGNCSGLLPSCTLTVNICSRQFSAVWKWSCQKQRKESTDHQIQPMIPLQSCCSWCIPRSVSSLMQYFLQHIPATKGTKTTVVLLKYAWQIHSKIKVKLLNDK